MINITPASEFIPIFPGDLKTIDVSLKDKIENIVSKCSKKYGLVVNIDNVKISYDSAFVMLNTDCICVLCNFDVYHIKPARDDIVTVKIKLQYDDIILCSLYHAGIEHKSIKLSILSEDSAAPLVVGEIYKVKIIDTLYVNNMYKCVAIKGRGTCGSP